MALPCVDPTRKTNKDLIAFIGTQTCQMESTQIKINHFDHLMFK